MKLIPEDLRDADTGVVDILAGRVIPLRLGYVPVVTRGQRDNMSKPIQRALDVTQRLRASSCLSRQGAILWHTFPCAQA